MPERRPGPQAAPPAPPPPCRVARGVGPGSPAGWGWLPVLAALLLLPLVAAALADNSDTKYDLVCPDGQQYNSSLDVCLLCDIGYFRSADKSRVNNKTTCEKCPNGFISRHRGAKSRAECDLPMGSRNECPDGTEWISRLERCVTCRAGSYRKQYTHYWCVDCPIGTNTSRQGATSLGQCMPDCPLGTVWNITARHCDPCGIGYYGDELDQINRCMPCPVGHVTYFPAADDVTICIRLPVAADLFSTAECPSGTQPDATSDICRMCSKGTYRSRDVHVVCSPCPAGLTTARGGATSPNACVTPAAADVWTGPVKCPPGTELHPARGCAPCSLGSYRSATLPPMCTPCPGGAPTPSTGATSAASCGQQAAGGAFTAERCPAGTEWDGHMCALCDYGTYRGDFRGDVSGACRRCPDNWTTSERGARDAAGCSMPTRGRKPPYFTTDSCPGGSEWSQKMRSCVPCHLGYYRPGPGSGALCRPCDAGKTTRRHGTRQRALCNVPVEGPDTLPLSQAGCPPGYGPLSSGFQAATQTTHCGLCPRAAYKPHVGRATCGYCPLATGGDMQPRQTAHRGATAQSHCLPDVKITGVSPSSIFQSEVRDVAIKMYTSAPDPSAISRVTIAGANCTLLHRTIIFGAVHCRLEGSRAVTSGHVQVHFWDGRVVTSSQQFTVRPDPVITGVGRLRTIVSGGLEVPVMGERLGAAGPQQMGVTARVGQGSTLTTAYSLCTVVNETWITCMTPNVSDWLNDGSRDKRATPEVVSIPSILGFRLGTIDTYKNMSAVMPQYGTVTIFRDPILFPIPQGIRVPIGNKYLTLNGKHLDGGVMAADYDVTVNTTGCPIVNLTSDTLQCEMAATLVTTTNHRMAIQVRVGPLEFNPGFVIFVDEKHTTDSLKDTTDSPNVATGRPPQLITSPLVPDNGAKETTTPPGDEMNQPNVNTSESVDDGDGLLDILVPLFIVIAVIVLIIIIVVVVVRLYRRRRHRRKGVEDDMLRSSGSSSSGGSDPRAPDPGIMPPLPLDSVFGPGGITDSVRL